MKITKPCQKITKKDPLWLGACRTCKAEAEAGKSELKILRTVGYDDEPIAVMPCPACKTPACNAAGRYTGMVFTQAPPEIRYVH